ncbi:MAG: ferrous iron transporter B [Pseudomonadota bacterium]
MQKKIVILGNINVGKTTLFVQLCNSNTKKFTYSDSTVSLTMGNVRGLSLSVIDTPGISSFFGGSEDEKISRNILISADADSPIQGAILVADAKHLKRAIVLVLQYIEYGIPLLLNLNMIDEIGPRGITIDRQALAELLQIEVTETVATEGIGIADLKSGLANLKVPTKMVKYPPKIEEFIELTTKLLAPSSLTSIRGIALGILAGDSSIESYLVKTFGSGTFEQLKTLAEQCRKSEAVPMSALLMEIYNKVATTIVNQVQQVDPPLKNRKIENFGRLCTTPLTGIPVAILVACFMFLFVGAFGADFLVDTINTSFFGGVLIPWIQHLLLPWKDTFFWDLIIGPDFGILPMGIFLALGLVMPVLFCFYFFFGLLEDSGYLPRLSVLLDKLFRKIGLNGKGFLPVVMGLYCITMAILTTRMLDTKKQRIIATLLLLLGIPCAPMLAVLVIILGKLPFLATLTIISIIVGQIIVIGFLANKFLPGDKFSLLMELPPMRIPKPLRILKNSFFRTYFYMKEAIPVFIGASLVVFVFDKLGGLLVVEKVLHPIVLGLLGLPDISTTVIIKTLIRRESGAATLLHFSSNYTNLQLVVIFLVMLVLAPCINAMIVILKEHGRKVGFLMLAFVTTYALIIGTTVNQVCKLLSITFK